MNIELKGTLKAIFAEEQITENFRKKKIVVAIDEDTQYPQEIIVDVLNDKISHLDNYKMGDSVIANANLRGKNNKGKYFNQLILWSIKKN
jgi:single-strand DNA-binding protein